MTQLTRNQQRLVEQNLNLARSIAHKFKKITAIEYDELESLAFKGLCQAIAAYDETRGTTISTFATPHIRGEILHYLRDKANTIKTPRNKDRLHIASLDAPIAEDMTLIETIADTKRLDLLETIADDEAIEDVPKLDRSAIEAKLHTLPKREREVARLLLQGLSAIEIAEKLNIPRNSVYVLKNRIKNRKIKGIRRRYEVEDYIDRDLSVLTKLEREVFELHLAGLTNQQIGHRLGKNRNTIAMTITRARHFLDNPRFRKAVGRPERRAFSKMKAPEIESPELRPVISNCAIAQRINNGWTIEEIAFSIGITPEETRSRLELINWRSDRCSQT